MKINFKSTILAQNTDEPNVIQFTAEVEKTSNEEYQVYDFREPSENIRNRIEISHDQKRINIFAGTVYVELLWQQEAHFTLSVTGPENQLIEMPITSVWNKKEFSENKYSFEYELFAPNGLEQMKLGDYHIVLTIEE
ncbi:hypothetical protein GE118_00630 [Mycoplasma sp. NEAQ87857]|uniref:hypothetical protein n=1 Tax=Mycoplasma sp. NEAQ87857 TaxID=2683967 RepID=UPI00131999F5|nr:hypothetical protein [Mycoplasma sp. NEAQ87857]QGZ97307.1 hypothetical protein GE118_00630 [Mycoplasma sp. NEAQ87857]